MPITEEIVSARNSWRYYRDKGHTNKAEFYFEYGGMLEWAKKNAQFKHTLNPSRPLTSWWEYIEPEVFIKIREMWAVIPDIHQNNRVPILIKQIHSIENSTQIRVRR